MFSAPLRRAATLACVLTSVLALGASAAQATIYEPNRFGDPLIGGAACTPPAPPEGCSLRGAINAAKAGDTVKLAAGTYTLSLGALEVAEKIAIEGTGPTATTIAQTAIDRVLEVKSGLTMSGVTITGGHVIGQPGDPGSGAGAEGKTGGNARGAGIEAQGPVTLTDVVVTGNIAFGGTGGNGASGSAGTPDGGKGGRGGTASGVGIGGGNPLVLTRVTVSDNVGTAGAGGNGGAAGNSSGIGGVGGSSGSSFGAGISTGISNVTITDSTISGNISKVSPAGNGGGSGALGLPGAGGQGEAAGSVGLFSNGTVKLTNVTISGNSAQGGIGGKGGNATTVAPISGGKGGNGLGAVGGGIGLYNGAEGFFASVTIAGNSLTAGTGGGGGSGPGGTGANGTAGGPRGGNLFLTSADATLRGSIVTDGIGDAGDEECAVASGSTLSSQGHNLIGRSGQCIAPAGPGDLLGASANLGPLAANGGPTQTLALLPGSAAIDAGETPCLGADNQVLATDQRGLPRGTPCDIGAFEVQPAPPPAPPLSPPPAAAPVLSGLKVKPKKLRNGQKSTVVFSLSASAKVSFELRRKTRTKSGKVRWVKSGGAPKAFTAVAGTTNRNWKPKGLKVSAYQLRATPAGGKTVTTGFKIVPKPKRR